MESVLLFNFQGKLFFDFSLFSFDFWSRPWGVAQPMGLYGVFSRIISGKGLGQSCERADLFRLEPEIISPNPKTNLKPKSCPKKTKVKIGLKNLAMLLSCFEYIFVHSRQKARLRPELSLKFFSTLGPTRKARPDLQFWVGWHKHY